MEYIIYFGAQNYNKKTRLANFELHFFTFSLFYFITLSPLRKLTTTVLLIIEVKFFQQLVTSFIETALAPVLSPI